MLQFCHFYNLLSIFQRYQEWLELCARSPVCASSVEVWKCGRVSQVTSPFMSRAKPASERLSPPQTNNFTQPPFRQLNSKYFFRFKFHISLWTAVKRFAHLYHVLKVNPSFFHKLSTAMIFQTFLFPNPALEWSLTIGEILVKPWENRSVGAQTNAPAVKSEKAVYGLGRTTIHWTALHWEEPLYTIHYTGKNQRSTIHYTV